jgi:hypothetical protein
VDTFEIGQSRSGSQICHVTDGMEGEDEVGNVDSEHMNVKQKMGIVKTLKLGHDRNGKQSKTGEAE